MLYTKWQYFRPNIVNPHVNIKNEKADEYSRSAMVNVMNEHADKTSVIVHSDNYTNKECPIHRVLAVIQQGTSTRDSP